MNLLKELLLVGSIFLFFCGCNIYSQTASGKYSKSTLEVSIGGEIFGSKNTAALIGFNVKCHYYFKGRMIGSILYKRGVDFTGIGAVEYIEEREKFINHLDEIGLLFGYWLSDIRTGPYGRIGISYLVGNKKNGQDVQTMGIPLEGGVNFQLLECFSIGFVLTGNLNPGVSYWGFNLNIGIGII
jgi:hypothetical protein